MTQQGGMYGGQQRYGGLPSVQAARRFADRAAAQSLDLDFIAAQSKADAEQAKVQATEQGDWSGWYLGLDLGKQRDPAILIVGERKRQVPPYLYHVRAIKQWALGTSYDHLLFDVDKMVRSMPPRPEDVLAWLGKVDLLHFTEQDKPAWLEAYRDANADPSKLPKLVKLLPADLVGAFKREVRARPEDVNLAIDVTGALPFLDFMRRARLPCKLWPISITSGTTAHTPKDEHGIWTVPKVQLASVLQQVIGTQRLAIAPVPLRSLLLRQLQTFQVKVRASGVEIFENARPSDHDDAPMGLSYLLWTGERTKRTASIWVG